MTFRIQIKWLAGKCFYQLRLLRSVRSALTLDTSKAVVHAFVSSRLDYCNSVFSLVRVKHLPPLQSVLNAAAVSCQDEGSTTISQASFVINCTGFPSPKGLNTSCAFWSTNVFTSWRRSTLSRCAKSSRNFQAAGIYFLLLVALSSNWEQKHRHMGRAVLQCAAREPGTDCHRTYATTHCPWDNLVAFWKLSRSVELTSLYCSANVTALVVRLAWTQIIHYITLHYNKLQWKHSVSNKTLTRIQDR